MKMNRIEITKLSKESIDYLKNIKNMKILLYSHFYNNQDNINQLLNDISNEFNLFNIEYHPENFSVKVKIKKTDIKKNTHYQCTPEYYYQLFSNVFYNYFNKNKNNICNLINTYKLQYNLTDNSVNDLYNPNNLFLFYNITVISDNIIIIYL